MNVFFMICVQNLVCQWRTEKQVSNYVSNLNAFQGYPGLATVSGLNTLAADPSYFLDAGHSSLLSVNSPTFKCNTLGRFNALSSVNGPINSFGLPRTGSIKHNPLTSYANSYVANPISEFDARNFHDFMLRKNVFFDDMYSDRIDCLQMDNKSPIKVQYSTQSLDRRRFLQQQFASPSSHPVRPQWPTTLPETQEHVTLRPLTTRPFDYLQRPGSMSALNTIGQTNDNSSSTTTTSTATATYANNQYYNNNNDDHKVNLNLQPPKSSSTSDLKKSLESTKQPINLRQTSDQNSSLHSIRDIAL